MWVAQADIAQPKQEEDNTFVFSRSYRLPKSISVSSLQLLSPVGEMADCGTTEVTNIVFQEGV